MVEEKTAEEMDTSQVLTPERLFSAILQELVRLRIRQRALLRLLAKSGAAELEAYNNLYGELEAEDFQPLMELLLLRREEFEKRYPEWLKKEREQYGFQRESVPAFRLERAALPERRRRKTPKKPSPPTKE
jgi:hypothetical protein